MTNTTGSISAVSNPSSGTTLLSQNTSSTSDILSSFKEIMSVMTAMNGLSTNAGSSNLASGMGMSMSDLMAPLMLILMERLIEGQLEQEAPAPATPAQASGTTTVQSPAGSATGPKPEPSGRPVAGGWISQGSHPGHVALDFAVPTGTSVKTTMDGNVVYAGWNDQGYGNLVIVENGEYRTYYAHLSSIPVSVGDQVTAGTTVGLSGNTGHSTGPHLHYEIRRNKIAIDPTAVTLG